MRCKFCFAGFKDVKNSILPKGHLPKNQALQVIEQLASIGFKKITFAGGEPTLCPWLSDLFAIAKQCGLTTMLVTNGSKLDEKFLHDNQNHLDWIAISIDSLNLDTNKEIGRVSVGKTRNQSLNYFEIAAQIKKYGYGYKVNTVVNRCNFNENLSEFILQTMPQRWKIFQVLPIIGQNDNHIDDFIISSNQFQQFINNHLFLQNQLKVVIESNELMKGSYAMVDPAGRFYDNTAGTYNYSQPILEVGAHNAIKQVNYNFDKFTQREGLYDWK